MPLFDSSSTVTSSTNLITSDIATKLSNSLSGVASKIANSNPARKGITIYNNLSSILYVDVDDTVSATTFMFRVEPAKYYEMPPVIYTGELWAVLSSGIGSVQIRELT